MSKISRLATIAGDRRYWGFYLQRQFRSPDTRNRVADFIARYKPTAEIGENGRGDAGNADLRADGIHMLGNLLDPAQCAEVYDFFSHKKVRDPYRPEVAKFLPLSQERPENAHIAHHDAEDILAAPYLLDIANDPRILDVVGRFLGCKPTIGYLSTWWSYPTPLGPQQAENYHRDVDDWRFVKLFIYITDVGPENGPHKYVVQTSSQPDLTEIRRFTDEEVAQTYGEGNIRTMTSKAGEGFLEDTYGIHKGQPVAKGTRLLFQVVYTLGALPYAPRKPVGALDPHKSYDPWTNRFYLK